MIKLIILTNKGELYIQKLSEKEQKLFKKEALNILKNQITHQINLLKKRIPKMKNITIQNLLNFSFVKNLNN